jgi:hypothetical protein
MLIHFNHSTVTEAEKETMTVSLFAFFVVVVLIKSILLFSIYMMN